MSTQIDRVSGSKATAFITRLAQEAVSGEGEDWQAGGSFLDLLQDLKRDGHISDALYVSGCTLVHDMTRCHGTSGGLTARYGDDIDGGSAERLPPQYPAQLEAFQRMDRVLNTLSNHEREFFRHCVLSRGLRRGTLADWGTDHSGFKTRQQARAYAIGQLVALVHTIHEAYRLKIPIAA